MFYCFFTKVTMLTVLTLFSFIFMGWATSICPPTCQCHGNLTTLVCKEQTLQHIPTLPDSTEELYVSYNQIPEIPEQGMEGLQVSNTIASITTLKNIFSLYIHNTKIMYLAIDIWMFSLLPNYYGIKCTYLVFFAS